MVAVIERIRETEAGLTIEDVVRLILGFMTLLGVFVTGWFARSTKRTTENRLVPQIDKVTAVTVDEKSPQEVRNGAGATENK